MLIVWSGQKIFDVKLELSRTNGTCVNHLSRQFSLKPHDQEWNATVFKKTKDISSVIGGWHAACYFVKVWLSSPNHRGLKGDQQPGMRLKEDDN